MHISKEKLPRGLSYPLKSGALEKAFSEAGITLDCSVNYIARPGDVTAQFWPPNPNVRFERIYITIYAVASDSVENARARMQGNVLPKLVSFLLEIIVLPPNSPIRREKQTFQRSLIS